MPRKRTVTSVKNACDRLWAQIVKARVGGICEHCRVRPGTESHHFYGRSNHRLRFDVRNGVSLCHACHRFAEQEQAPFVHWFEGDRTEDAAYLSLERLKGLIHRTLTDYIELETELKAELAQWSEELAA